MVKLILTHKREVGVSSPLGAQSPMRGWLAASQVSEPSISTTKGQGSAISVGEAAIPSTAAAAALDNRAGAPLLDRAGTVSSAQNSHSVAAAAVSSWRSRQEHGAALPPKESGVDAVVAAAVARFAFRRKSTMMDLNGAGHTRSNLFGSAGAAAGTPEQQTRRAAIELSAIPDSVNSVHTEQAAAAGSASGAFGSPALPAEDTHALPGSPH